MRREALERAQRREAGCERLRVRGDLVDHALRDLGPAFGQLAAHAPLELARELRMRRAITLEARVPRRLRFAPARRAAPRRPALGGHEERLLLPAARLHLRRVLHPHTV